MNRASNAFSVLQATAAVASIAILLWSVGLPSLRFAEAASVTGFSDTLSTSEPSVGADHTIVFVTPGGVASGQSIVLTFDSEGQAFDLTGIGIEDVDMYEGATLETFAGNWSVTVNTSLDTITITSLGAGGVIAPGATTTIEVGTHADADGVPDTQITNPGAAQSYDVQVDVNGGTDTGETRVAILSTVNVTASVDTLFTFNVAGLPGGTTVSGTTTGGTTTATDIPFGKLDPGVASTAAQQLSVITNARNGFVVTVEADGMLRSTNGADIDGFINGSYTSTSTPWQAPGGTVGQENEYGHWGITSNDTDYFAAGEYVSASTTPVQVFTHTGPTDGTGSGLTNVGYTVQITSLQEAADQYQATLTYVATPVF